MHVLVLIMEKRNMVSIERPNERIKFIDILLSLLLRAYNVVSGKLGFIIRIIHVNKI